MELWDAYDKNLNRIEGVALVRGEPIPDGFFHLVCEIIVRHKDGSWLIMRRDPRKPFGGMWEATAGGSALCGESPIECAQRELFEETGLRVQSLAEVGRVTSHDTVYVEFLAETDCDKDGVRLQECETVDHKWINRGELMRMESGELLTSRIQRFIRELNG